MKVNVRVIFEKTEMVFEIPIGMGDKSFKWLGLVACSRFAACAPNGGLRRRDPPRRGITDKATHQPVEMALSDGQIPHPSALLYDFCRDGDEVRVHLVDSQELVHGTGVPHRTQWSELAFGNKAPAANEGDASPSKRGGTGGAAGVDVITEEDHVYNEQQQRGRAQFMRILLKSQMSNPAAISEQVQQAWKTVRKAMPRITAEGEAEIISVLKDYWDMANDIFSYFAKITRGTQGKLPQEGFYQILYEGKIFPDDILKASHVRIFARACAAAENGDIQLSLGGLVVALILVTQAKYNDTFDETNAIVGPGQGLKDIFANYLKNVAERFEMKSVLKESFMSTHFLNQLREWHDELFAVFNKYAGRSRELPSSINYVDMTMMLYDAGLTEAEETDTKGNPISFEHVTVKKLLQEVRQGTINGRAVIDEAAANKNGGGGIPDDIIPGDEFTYPEMVEAICRHSFNRYRGTKPDEYSGITTYFDYAGDLSIADCYVKGMVSVIGTLSGRVVAHAVHTTKK
jgi:hypothetical protein